MSCYDMRPDPYSSPIVSAKWVTPQVRRGQRSGWCPGAARQTVQAVLVVSRACFSCSLEQSREDRNDPL